MSSKNVSAATSPPCHDGRSQTEKCGDGHHRGITMVGHTMMVVVQTKLNEPRRGDCDGTTRRSFDGERAAGDTHHHHRPTEQQTSSPRSSSSATPLAWPAASKLPSRARPLFSYGESSSSRASRRHAQRRRLQDGPRGANERRAVVGSSGVVVVVVVVVVVHTILKSAVGANQYYTTPLLRKTGRRHPRGDESRGSTRNPPHAQLARWMRHRTRRCQPPPRGRRAAAAA